MTKRALGMTKRMLRMTKRMLGMTGGSGDPVNDTVQCAIFRTGHGGQCVVV